MGVTRAGYEGVWLPAVQAKEEGAGVLEGAPVFCLWLAPSGGDVRSGRGRGPSVGGSSLVIEALRAGTNPGGPVSCP
jgi:hypothetical protein